MGIDRYLHIYCDNVHLSWSSCLELEGWGLGTVEDDCEVD